jgi:hypothetical protein
MRILSLFDVSSTLPASSAEAAKGDGVAGSAREVTYSPQRAGGALTAFRMSLRMRQPMFYWIFQRRLFSFFREIFARKVIVSGTLTLPPLSSRSTND